MFGLFKQDPLQKLEKEYEKTMEQAVQAQRNGNIDLFSKLSQDADNILKKIDELKQSQQFTLWVKANYSIDDTFIHFILMTYE